MIGPRAQQVKPALGFQFVALPVEILRRSDLSAAAKLLAAVVMDSARSSRSGSCKLTNAGLGARIGRSAASVKRLLGELEAAGLVRRDHVAEKHQRSAVVPTWGVAQESTTGRASAAQDRSTPGSETTHPPVQERAAIQSPGSEPNQTGPVLSTLEGEEPRPSPAEVASAIREMIGGKHASALFREVGYSARAAIVQAKPHRKTADQQLAELARWSRRTGAPSPPPGRAARSIVGTNCPTGP